MLQRFVILLVSLGFFSFFVVSCAPSGTSPNTPPQVTGPKVTITGTVKDCVTLRPLPDATIKVEIQEKGVFFASTDREGFFILEVPLGHATITVIKPGYERLIAWADLTTSGSVLRLSPQLCPQEE